MGSMSPAIKYMQVISKLDMSQWVIFILDYRKGGLSSLVLYLTKSRTTGEKFYYCGMFCYWVHDLNGYIFRKGINEEEQVSPGAWGNGSLYK